MSAAQKRRGATPPAVKGPPWSKKRSKHCLGRCPMQDMAAKIGRTLSAFKRGRYRLEIERFLG